MSCLMSQEVSEYWAHHAKVRRFTMPAEFALNRYSPLPDQATAEMNCPGGLAAV